MDNTVGIIDREIAFRLSARPSVPLYAGARSAGMLHLENGWTQPEKTPDYLEFFWCGSGTFQFPLLSENRRVLLTPGTAMFLFPGDLHCQQVCSKEARYYWLTIDGHPEELIRHYSLTREPFYAGEPPQALFQRLISELGYISSFMQYQASHTALEIIQAVEGSVAPTSCLETPSNYCEYADDCPTLPFWTEFYDVIRTFLENRTLKDIMEENKI